MNKKSAMDREKYEKYFKTCGGDFFEEGFHMSHKEVEKISSLFNRHLDIIESSPSVDYITAQLETQTPQMFFWA